MLFSVTLKTLNVIIFATKYLNKYWYWLKLLTANYLYSSSMAKFPIYFSKWWTKKKLFLGPRSKDSVRSKIRLAKNLILKSLPIKWLVPICSMYITRWINKCESVYLLLKQRGLRSCLLLNIGFWCQRIPQKSYWRLTPVLISLFSDALFF